MSYVRTWGASTVRSTVLEVQGCTVQSLGV